MASSPAVASPSTASAGLLVNPASFCQCGCCRDCSAAVFLEELDQAHRGQLQFFFGEYATLVEERPGLRRLARAATRVRMGRVCQAPVRRSRGSAYLSRYTHRVAISNQRLLALDERGVTFRWKDSGPRARRATRP